MALARRLGVDKVLTSRVLKALRNKDAIAVIKLAPGPAPLRRLLRAAAQRLAEAASADFLAELGQAEDIAAVAQEHGGAWTAVAWVERTDGQVPTEVLATAFRLAKPQAGAVIRELVSVASGDYAVLVLSAVEAGQIDSIPREEQARNSAQLAEQASMSELTGYAAEVRNEATVIIPDIVLNPIF